jgi:hypothetical protein
MERLLDKIMVLFRFIHGKDVFEAFYKKVEKFHFNIFVPSDNIRILFCFVGSGQTTFGG